VFGYHGKASENREDILDALESVKVISEEKISLGSNHLEISLSEFGSSK